MELIATTTQTGQDLTTAKTIATLAAPAFGAAMYAIDVLVSNLGSGGWSIYFTRTVGVVEYVVTTASVVSGVTAWAFPIVRVPMNAGDAPVTVKMVDTGFPGGATAATYTARVFREDSVNITSVDGADADPDANRNVQIIQRNIIVNSR